MKIKHWLNILIGFPVVLLGQVGIGTTSIDGILHLDNLTSDTDLIIEKDDATSGDIIFHNAGAQVGYIGMNTSENLVIENEKQDVDVIFRVNNGGSNSDLMFIDGSLGVAGIKGSESGIHLYVYNSGTGILEIEGATTSAVNGAEAILYSASDYRGRGVRMMCDDDDEWYIGVPYTGDGFTIGRHASQPEYDANASIFIQEDGDVGVGTAAPSYKLDVYTNDGSTFVTQFVNDGNNTNREGIGIQAGADNASGTNVFVHLYDGDGTDCGGLRYTSSAISIFTTSDRRFKAGIRDTELNGLEIVKDIAIRDYYWKENLKEQKTGVIAQEVKKVYPPMAHKTIERKGKKYWAVSMDRLIPAMTKAAQQQDAQLENALKESFELTEGLESLLSEVKGE